MRRKWERGRGRESGPTFICDDSVSLGLHHLPTIPKLGSNFFPYMDLCSVSHPTKEQTKQFLKKKKRKIYIDSKFINFQGECGRQLYFTSLVRGLISANYELRRSQKLWKTKSWHHASWSNSEGRKVVLW